MEVVFVELFRHSMVGCFLFEHIYSHCVRVVRNVLNMSSDLCVFVRVGYSTEKPENGSLFCVLTLVYYCCRCRCRSWSVYGAWFGCCDARSLFQATTAIRRDDNNVWRGCWYRPVLGDPQGRCWVSGSDLWRCQLFAWWSIIRVCRAERVFDLFIYLFGHSLACANRMPYKDDTSNLLTRFVCSDIPPHMF